MVIYKDLCLKLAASTLALGCALIGPNVYANTSVGHWNIVSLHAGSTRGYAEGIGAAAQFEVAYGIAVDNAGTVYVADSGNNRIRTIDANGTTSLLAGSTGGYTEGTGAAAQFLNPRGVAIDSAGIVYVADRANNRIRTIDVNGTTSLLAGSGTLGYAEGTRTSAQFFFPSGIAVDSAGINGMDPPTLNRLHNEPQ